MNEEATRNLVSDAYLMQMGSYTQMAAVVLTTYDHIITFDDEIRRVWQSRWSANKIFFLICRYGGLLLISGELLNFLNPKPTEAVSVLPLYIHIPLLHRCLWGIRVTALIAIIISCTTQAIMQFRIRAIYPPGSILTKILIGFFVVEIIILLAFGFLILQGIEVAVAYSASNVQRCICTKFPSYSFMFWVPILCFDTFLFILAAYRLRGLDEFKVLDIEQLLSSLIVIVIRDNFGYFFLMFAMYLATAIVWFSADIRYYVVPARFSYSMTVIMGCRVTLNLSDAYYNTPDKINWDSNNGGYRCYGQWVSRRSWWRSIDGRNEPVENIENIELKNMDHKHEHEMAPELELGNIAGGSKS